MIITARKRYSGFTLIELLIVIAILGILAAAVLVAVNPAKRQNQAKDANIKADIGSIGTAATAYFTSPGQGSYPVSIAALVANKDLKQEPIPPAGGTYEYVTNDPACLGTPASPCAEVTISEPMYDPPVAGNVWCWRSATGKAEPLTPAPGTCVP